MKRNDSTNYSYKDKPKGKPRGKPGTVMSTKQQVVNEKKEELTRITYESNQYRSNPKTRTNEEIRVALDRYFQDCEEKGQIPTVEDMALALGTSRQVLWDWERRTQTNPERAELIIRAKETIAAIDAKLALEGKINPVVYIFRSKNYYGMKDQQEVVVAPVNPLGDGMSNEELRKKYLENTYGISEELPGIIVENPQIEEGEVKEDGKQQNL